MLNKILLIGNLGKDPELNVTPDGTPVTKFSLAVNRRYKGANGEQKEETEWFNIVTWRQLAEICERYLHKGSKVYIEGRLSADARSAPLSFLHTSPSQGNTPNRDPFTSMQQQSPPGEL